jgi:hypothetical protein
MPARDAADGQDAGLRPPNYAPTENLKMLLLISIATAWLAVIALFVAICRTAAEGERRGFSLDELRSVSIGPKLVLSSTPERVRAPHRRPHAHGTAGGSRRTARRSRSAHGVR